MGPRHPAKGHVANTKVASLLISVVCTSANCLCCFLHRPSGRTPVFFRVEGSLVLLTDGLLPCLRTQNSRLWIEAFHGQGQLLLSRRLHPLERFTVQGLPAVMGACMDSSTALRCSGNAFSIPIIGPVLVALNNVCCAGLRKYGDYSIEQRL